MPSVQPILTSSASSPSVGVVASAGAGIESGGQVVGEGGERPALALETPAPGGQQVVDRDPVHPGAQRAVATEAAKPGDDLYEDLLGGVLGVVWVPQHAHRQAVHVILDGAHHLVEGVGVAAAGPVEQRS
jgi:hypothetical protein